MAPASNADHNTRYGMYALLGEGRIDIHRNFRGSPHLDVVWEMAYKVLVTRGRRRIVARHL